jgi:hypothetical protein
VRTEHPPRSRSGWPSWSKARRLHAPESLRRSFAFVRQSRQLGIESVPQGFSHSHITNELVPHTPNSLSLYLSCPPSLVCIMSHQQQTTTTSTFTNHGAGFTHDANANNNGHLGAATARDGDTLSAGSTANGSFSRMAEHNGNGNNALEKDFSRQNGMITTLFCT